MIQQSHSWTYTHGNLIQKDTFTLVYNSTIYNSQDKEANEMSIDKWMDKKRCSIYIQWNITQPKKNEIMPFATTCMHIILIEV